MKFYTYQQLVKLLSEVYGRKVYPAEVRRLVERGKLTRVIPPESTTRGVYPADKADEYIAEKKAFNAQYMPA